MTGEIFIFKINISYKNINSYGNIIIIFLLHFLYNFQYILRNQISFKNNRYISNRKWTKIIKYPIGILFFRRILKSYRSFVQIHLEFILLYEVPKYPIMCPMWIMTFLWDFYKIRPLAWQMRFANSKSSYSLRYSLSWHNFFLKLHHKMFIKCHLDSGILFERNDYHLCYKFYKVILIHSCKKQS